MEWGVAGLRVLVTGATGFLGSHIALALHQAGLEVEATGRNPHKAQPLHQAGLPFHAGDLEDQDFVRCIATGRFDAIVHSAALSSPWGAYETFYRANVLVTEYLVEACRTAPIRRLVHISTPSIYFDFCDRFNISEADPLPARFANAYAATKFKAEQAVEWAGRTGLETIILRPRAIIGSGDTTIMPRLLRAQQAGRLRIIGHGRNIVDVTAAANVADAVLLALQAPPPALGHSYNITNGEPILLWKLVEQVLQHLGQTLDRRRIPFPIALALARSLENLANLSPRRPEPVLTAYGVGVLAKSQTLNIEKARSLLGYKPRQTVMQAVKAFTDWYLAQTH